MIVCWFIALIFFVALSGKQFPAISDVLLQSSQPVGKLELVIIRVIDNKKFLIRSGNFIFIFASSSVCTKRYLFEYKSIA